MKFAYFLLFISLSLNSLPRQNAQKIPKPNQKPEKSDRAMGPCFKGENVEKCGEGFECDQKDNLCKRSTKTAKKSTLLALSVRKKRQVGIKCSNGFNPASQCFGDGSCGYQYQCESGPQMKVCCNPSGSQLVQQQQQQQPVGWPAPIGGCRPTGCQGGCNGGCQQQQQQQQQQQVQYQVPQQVWLPFQTSGGCPSSFQDIGQCYSSPGSCSTSGYGQCFGTRCCEPVISTVTPSTTANGCMFYVPQLGRSFDVCTGNTKCINGQCVPVQTSVTSPVTTGCVPNPCPNFYNQMNMCCWQKRRK